MELERRPGIRAIKSQLYFPFRGIGKERPADGRTPPATRQMEELISSGAEEQYSDEPIRKPASVGFIARFYFQERPGGKRGDWDNLGKLVSDALQGVCYDNDSQIVFGQVEIHSGCTEPGISVMILELDSDDPFGDRGLPG